MSATSPLTTHAADTTDAARARTGRLEFLDAARGVAAVVVALQHTAENVWPDVLAWSHTWFRPGEFGVLVFFLCSGFIIPASLERRGSLVEFWIGRAFRLWPLYLTALAVAAIGLVALPDREISPGHSPLLVLAINATMVQVFSQAPLVIGASWTLGYELAFYLIVSGLFALGWHRGSARISLVLLAGAMVVGTSVPALLVTVPSAASWATAAGLAALVALPALLSDRPPRTRLVAAGFLGLAVLMVANRPHDAYFPLLLLGTMFLGTALYRWTTGQMSGRATALVLAGACALVVVTLRAHHVGYTEPITGTTPHWWTEASTFLGAYLLFGGLLLLRRHRFPRVLVYLGTISYSVYLVHAVVLLLVPGTGGAVRTFVTWNVLTIVIAGLSYRLVERPGIAAGRGVVRWWRARVESAAGTTGHASAGTTSRSKSSMPDRS